MNGCTLVHCSWHTVGCVNVDSRAVVRRSGKHLKNNSQSVILVYDWHKIVAQSLEDAVLVGAKSVKFTART